MNEPDELLRALAALYDRTDDLDTQRREHLRARAHRVLQRSSRAVARWERTYTRLLEPILAGGLSCLALLWAFQRAIEILGPPMPG
ncbi:MAG: hypothetical protein JXR96_19560 [Deltaproteobacteria bacterium]|nr:hypothetical protein [Deltaproteobacteria bacterium]